MAAEQRGVASVEVAAAILKALRPAAEPVRLVELSALTGIGAPRLHHYLVSLVRTGLVRQDAAARGYALGSFALELGLAAADNLSAQHASAPWLRRLSSNTGESSFFAMPSSRGMLIVRWEQGANPLTVHARLGTVMPVLESATGLLWLAFDRARGGAAMEAELRKVAPALRAAAREARLAESAQARRLGIAAAKGSMINDINALACPVVTRGSQLAGVLAVLGLAARFRAEPGGKAGLLLRRAAREFGARLP